MSDNGEDCRTTRNLLRRLHSQSPGTATDTWPSSIVDADKRRRPHPRRCHWQQHQHPHKQAASAREGGPALANGNEKGEKLADPARDSGGANSPPLSLLSSPLHSPSLLRPSLQFPNTATFFPRPLFFTFPPLYFICLLLQ